MLTPGLQPVILHYDTLPSTNTEAATQAALGAPEGLCIIAREQTAGRGREERRWQSPVDAGLYFSIVLRPRFPLRFWPLITLMTAIAVHDTLESLYQLECDIKWPNDLLCGQRKLCGILAETVETKTGTAVVLGIGINLLKSAVTAGLEDTATSVEEWYGSEPDRDMLVRELIRQLSFRYGRLQDKNGQAEIVTDWTARSSFAAGKRVRVSLLRESFDGVTSGLEPDGALKVTTDDGNIRVVRSGDVIALRPASLSSPPGS